MSVPLRIALTGGIGSGKSTIALKFQQLGVPVIDSDIIAREVVQPGSSCLHKIIQEFGSEVVTSSGNLDREALRAIIFKDHKAKTKLEHILHPEIYEEIENQISKIQYPYCIIVIPLLIETNSMNRFDRILVIDAPESEQKIRASKRDKTSSIEIEKILNSQASREQRLEYADDIINNNSAIEILDESVNQLHKKYLELSS
jgi:dephospho-CoA kinase